MADAVPVMANRKDVKKKSYPKRFDAHQLMKNVVQSYLANKCLRIAGEKADELISNLPTKWQKHGDVMLFPDSSFADPFWHELPETFWQEIAQVHKVSRLGVMGKTVSNGFRQPTVTYFMASMAGLNILTTMYSFDVTRTMFSSGNITEKLRVSKFDCTDQVVVDLYAGIGYYTLPYLVHTKARHVHACEWNPDAVTALRKGLAINKVSDRCTVYEGDNSKAGLENIADRINLGLLPTSRDGWSVACIALKPTGGFLHIHDSLNSKGQDRLLAEKNYTLQTISDIKQILADVKPNQAEWDVTALHLERVKSYAPHITHIVLDLHCVSNPLEDE
ncbi:TRMT12 [Bugula neritina]|uniref:tRNA(Phe) (4-demethylwyosine(37)-C(7)) aminocarboxypropyltransferase n=1 Tax=Bugula neritina TaxID=10212 RepID=A0A7J7J6R2_BUGNE|nr:TRMT12 [Bugula neritina]